jgi:hypothetical protein
MVPNQYGPSATPAPARLSSGTRTYQLQQIAVANWNVFASLMKTMKCCLLRQIANALFEAGRQCRRNM